MDALGVLQRLGGGHLMEELYELLQRMAEEAVATGKAGSVTLKLTISTQSQGDPMVVIQEQLSCAPPKKDPRGAYFFAVDGGLYKEDPRQLKMDFRMVNKETGEIKEVRMEQVERTIAD